MTKSSDPEGHETIHHALLALGEAVHRLLGRVGRPIYIAQEQRPRFRYPENTPNVFLYLRAVRIVSGLNAMLHLLDRGFFQEMGVIARTIDDFLGEMRFVFEADERDEPTADQKRLIERFFADDHLTEAEFHSSDQLGFVPKRKDRAAEARLVSPVAEVNKTQESQRYVDAGFSGYVHGNYSQIMELYEGTRDGRDEGFYMNGMPVPPRIRAWERQIAIHVVAALAETAALARLLGDDEIASGLLALRMGLEAAPIYRK